MANQISDNDPIPLRPGDTESNEAHALKYAERGWRVFPVYEATSDGGCSCPAGKACDKPGKHPDSKLVRKGHLDATTDPKKIHRWWTTSPTRNIGIATGDLIIVADVDARSGGLETFANLEAKNSPADTLRATTSGGGFHLYYKAPADVEMLHSGPHKIDGIPQGIDFKIKGYVVAPPSLHKSGKQYAWVNYEVPPAELPNWLREIIPASDPTTSAPFMPVEHALLDLAYERIKKAAPGTGHDTVNRQGFVVGQHVGTGEIPRSAAEAVLNSAFAGRNEQESLKRVLRAGLEKGMANPKFAQNDVGNSQRLASIFKDKIRYCDALGWLVWTDEGRWEPDDSGEIMVCAKKTVANIDIEASQIKNDAAQKKLRVHAHNSGQASKLKAMVDLARSEIDIPMSMDELDADPYLLGVASGTVDLKTGLLHEAEPWELITKKTACAYDPEALCPTWDRFFDWAFNGNERVKRFVQKAIGYSLTGDTKEDCYFFCYGSGQNGKSTMLNTLDDLWGDYGEVSDFSSFTVKQNDGPRNDIAKLKGSRLVSASEITRGKHLDEALVKQITGGDPITARFFRKEFFSFKPTFKLWFAGNDKPEITGTGDSIWGRTRLLPFTQTVAPDDRDLKLREKLRAEGPGILAWGVRGCLLWQEEGLKPPPEVLAASQGYRDEMDLIGNFLSDKDYCDLDPKADAGVVEAWDRFKAWCTATNERLCRRKEFVSAVVAHGYEKVDRNKGFRLMGFRVVGSPDY